MRFRRYFAAVALIALSFAATNTLAGDPAERHDAACDRAWATRVEYLTALQTGRPADPEKLAGDWAACYPPMDPTMEGP